MSTENKGVAPATTEPTAKINLQTGTVTPIPEKIYTSEKLTEIENRLNALLDTDQSKMDRAAKLKINLDLFALQNDEKAEIASLKKAESEAKVQEARNAKTKLVDDFGAAAIENYIASNDKKLSIDDKNAKNDTFHKLRENVVNAVLGSKPVTASTGTATATGTKGETGTKIRDRYIALKAEGKTNTEAEKAIVAEGFSRGTTGAVCLAYRREIGEVA